MKTLHTFGPAFGLPDASPFCIKAMCLLNMSEAAWENNPGFDSRKAPMQKLPVLIDNDKTIADSDSIRHYLEEQCNTDFDQSLDNSQKAVARSVIRLAEEHLYFCCMYDRWKRDDNWAHVKSIFFSDLPKPLQYIVPGIVRRSVLASLHGQGIGRFSYGEMVARADKDLSAIESLIGDGPFLFGDAPVAADASVASVLAVIAVSPENTELKQRITSSKVLTNYISTARDKLFPQASGLAIKLR